MVIYRSLYSNQHPVTINQFIDEFILHLGNIITTSDKIAIGGDFNIHVDRKNDFMVRKFLDTLDSYNLLNNIDFSSHIFWYTRNLIVSCKDEFKFLYTEPKSYISHHCFLKPSPNIK